MVVHHHCLNVPHNVRRAASRQARSRHPSDINRYCLCSLHAAGQRADYLSGCGIGSYDCVHRDAHGTAWLEGAVKGGNAPVLHPAQSFFALGGALIDSHRYVHRSVPGSGREVARDAGRHASLWGTCPEWWVMSLGQNRAAGVSLIR